LASEWSALGRRRAYAAEVGVARRSNTSTLRPLELQPAEASLHGAFAVAVSQARRLPAAGEPSLGKDARDEIETSLRPPGKARLVAVFGRNCAIASALT